MSEFSSLCRIIFFLLLLVACNAANGQRNTPKFRRITTNDGLSQGHVSAILKDHRGFMWFGTDEGLNRYDGYNFVVYKHDPADSTTICDNGIVDILEDRSNNLWVATLHGLDKYDRQKAAFIHYSYYNNILTIKDIFQDSRNRIWLATLQGFYLFNPASGSFRRYQHLEHDTNSLSHNFVCGITEDKQGNLWIGTQAGLDKFNPRSQCFTRYTHDAGNKKSISTNWIKAVYADYKGRIWAGTQGGGISLFNQKENAFISFKHDPLNKNSVVHNDILSFAENEDNDLLIGTENGGISVFNYEKNTFVSYCFDPADNNSLSNNSIYSLYKDNIGNIWAGTWSGGVNFLPRFGDKFTVYRPNMNDDNSLSNNIVLSITGDSTGHIWLGTDGGGLNKFDLKTRTFTRYRNNSNNKNSLRTDYVTTSTQLGKEMLGFGYHRFGFDLYNAATGVFSQLKQGADSINLISTSISVTYKDREGNLWLGAQEHSGLFFYDVKDGKLVHYRTDLPGAKGISGNSILSLLMDGDKNVWLGTDDGLEMFDRKTGQFVHYRTGVLNSHTISNNLVHSILEDGSGNLWLGTSNGLNFFDKKTKSFTAYTTKNGLANNVIFGLMQDKKGNIWFSSNKGLSCFNPVTKICRNYDISDGLQDNSFKPNAYYQTADGTMYYGGVNGFNVFNPDSIRDNTFVPPLLITGLRIFNKSVNAGGDSPVRDAISETKEIKLSYKQSVLTFEFSALNFTLPEKNLYAYKLEGFDKEWTYASNQRTATYTNLDPGRYVLYVKGSNNDAVWNNQPTTLTIIITPPFWLTWLFKITAFFLIIGISFLIYKWRVSLIESQKKKLQAQVRQRTSQLIHKTEEERRARLEAENANKAKSVFLATMSHEIRTPMNGVIGMAALLTETELNREQKNYVETITSCGESLLTVINDILDFSKIESDSMEMENIDFNLQDCIEEVLDMFAAKAASTGLDLVYQIHPTVPAQINGDALRLRQVLINLVSNAIKFTQQGEIFVEVHLLKVTEDKKLELRFDVRDTGIGIEQDKIERLFKAFSQVDSSTTRKYGGTGLGLVISEKLVKLMQGDIHVVSQPGKGTNFNFTIMASEGLQPVRTNLPNTSVEMENKRILVVDDNSTNLMILEKQLTNWKLLPTLVKSGEEALDLLSGSQTFDLLLTDMYMSGMDGVQLAQAMKKKFPDMPMVLLSSMGDSSMKKFPGLFRSVLTKPIRHNVLYNLILNEFKNPGSLPVTDKVAGQKLSVDFSRHHPLTILIAEDNPINQQLAIRVLSKLGYAPDIVENGLEVLEALTEKVYDVILMDVQMPEMDGMVATRKIRELVLDVQPVIIAMTANAMQGDEAACLEAGMNDYLSKPIRLDALLLKLEKWAVSRV